LIVTFDSLSRAAARVSGVIQGNTAKRASNALIRLSIISSSGGRASVGT
jgi:hypothetical protein